VQYIKPRPFAGVGPLRRYIRRLLRGLARLLLSLLTTTRVIGQERLPRHGPYILAGNHDAAIEVVLMLAVAPGPIEFLGTGDVPLDHRFRFLGRLHGFIPYRRGELDRPALRRCVELLETGGILGIFPEGGIWQSGPKTVQRGVAWLSLRTNTPVVPMAFAGVRGAIPKALTFRRPHLTVNVGTPMQASRVSSAVGRNRLEDLAGLVAERIQGLLEAAGAPARERPEPPQGLHLALAGPGRTVAERWHGPQARAVAVLLRSTLVSNVFAENLHRHVDPLARWGTRRPLAETVHAVRVILGFLALRNRGFLTYRFGPDMARRMHHGLGQLRDRCIRGTQEGFEAVVIAPLSADGTQHPETRSDAPEF
jgi:1-acyl-sn-glycerol-3-phosphate acyltransferase